MPIFTKNSGTKMLRTLIIDDEPHIRETLQGLLSNLCPQVKLIGQAVQLMSGQQRDFGNDF